MVEIGIQSPYLKIQVDLKENNIPVLIFTFIVQTIKNIKNRDILSLNSIVVFSNLLVN